MADEKIFQNAQEAADAVTTVMALLKPSSEFTYPEATVFVGLIQDIRKNSCRFPEIILEPLLRLTEFLGHIQEHPFSSDWYIRLALRGCLTVATDAETEQRKNQMANPDYPPRIDLQTAITLEQRAAILWQEFYTLLVSVSPDQAERHRISVAKGKTATSDLVKVIAANPSIAPKDAPSLLLVFRQRGLTPECVS